MIDDRVIEAFVRGFSFTRSFTHPYIAKRVGGIWLMSDAPRTSGDYRNDEWIATNLDPTQIDRTARKHSRAKFGVCVIQELGESDHLMRAEFKKLGYRLQTTEPMMVHGLARIPECKSPATIHRVLDQSLADRLAKAARSRQILREHLKPSAPLRQYVAIIKEQIVGWVRSIHVGDSTWCASMYVQSRFRRQGIGRALLAQMLRDDRAAGAKQAVLLASHTGAKLYPVVGYEQIGTLYLFKLIRKTN